MHNQYFQRIFESITRQGLMKQMGYRLGYVDKGYVEVILPYSEKIMNQVKGYHGGAIGTIGDIAAGYAGLTIAPENMEVTTVEYKINFLSAYQGGSLVAVGKVIKPGKKLIVTHADIYHINEPYDPMGHYFEPKDNDQAQYLDHRHQPRHHNVDEKRIVLPKANLCAALQMTLFTIPKPY